VNTSTFTEELGFANSGAEIWGRVCVDERVLANLQERDEECRMVFEGCSVVPKSLAGSLGHTAALRPAH